MQVLWAVINYLLKKYWTRNWTRHLTGVLNIMQFKQIIYLTVLICNILRFFFVCLWRRQMPYKPWWLQNTGKYWNGQALTLDGTGYRGNTFFTFREWFVISFSVFTTENAKVFMGINLKVPSQIWDNFWQLKAF